MEILILNRLLQPIDVVDVFESVIWAERFWEMGDFELVVLSTFANRRRFIPQALLGLNKSDRIMEVLTIEETSDAEDRMVLKVKGKELIHLLDKRLAVKWQIDEIAPVWVINDRSPGDVMRYIFDIICVTAELNEADRIPFVFPGTLYPPDTIVEYPDDIVWEQKPDTVYKALTTIGDIYDLGIRLYKDPNASKLYFDVYAGCDRTTAQTELPPVIFSNDMENLQNTTELNDISSTFNVVHVIFIYKNEEDVEATLSVYVTDNPELPPEEFDRRVKLLVLTNMPEETTDIEAWMIQCGMEELRKSRAVLAFDGEVSPVSQYIYRRDFNLGDLVEVRSATGATGFMRVVEYIFAEDLQGERSYPSMVTKEFSGTGTWDSWKYDVAWEDMPETEVWDNQ